jgi:hypothetical protein
LSSRIVFRIHPYPWGQLPPNAQAKVREMVSDVWVDPFTEPDKAWFMNMTPLDNAIKRTVEKEFAEAVPIGAISCEYPAFLRHDNSGDDTKYGRVLL